MVPKSKESSVVVKSAIDSLGLAAISAAISAAA